MKHFNSTIWLDEDSISPFKILRLKLPWGGNRMKEDSTLWWHGSKLSRSRRLWLILWSVRLTDFPFPIPPSWFSSGYSPWDPRSRNIDKNPYRDIIVFGSLIFDFVRMPQLQDIMGDWHRFQLSAPVDSLPVVVSVILGLTCDTSVFVVIERP